MPSLVGADAGGAVTVRDVSANLCATSRIAAERRGVSWHGGPVPYSYKPRDYLRQPRFFGRKVEAEWKAYGDDFTERARVAAAYWQHLAACETLRVAGEKDWKMGDLAAKIGAHPDTLRRKLYGEGPATLDDVISWALAVDAVTVLPAPADMGRVFPPTAAPNGD